jgi:hypothetical protein
MLLADFGIPASFNPETSLVGLLPVPAQKIAHFRQRLSKSGRQATFSHDRLTL